MWCCTALISYFLIWIWFTLIVALVGVCWRPHFDICVELSCCTTGLWTHWFQHEKGSHLMFCLLVYFVLGMLYLVLLTSLLPVSQSISCFWLTSFDLLWTIGCVLICAWEERAVLWLTATDSWPPVERVICILQETCERGDRSIITGASGCGMWNHLLLCRRWQQRAMEKFLEKGLQKEALEMQPHLLILQMSFIFNSIFQTHCIP